MNDFLDAFLKIQSEYFRRMQLLFILDLFSIFSIFYAIFIIFNVQYFLEQSSLYEYLPNSIIKIITPVLALIIAIVGALLLHKNDHKVNVLLITEKKYPELKEKLRTAYDNRNETNVIIDSLKSLVLSGLTVVSASKLLSTGVIVTKIVITVIFISAATTVSLNPEKYTIPPETITNFTKAVTGDTGEDTNMTIDAGSSPDDQTGADKNGSGNIFGKPKIASLEGRNIDLTIFEGIGPGYNVKEASQEQNQFTTSPVFPADVLGSNVSDGGYSTLMKKTADEKKLIEDYAVKRS